MVHSGGFAEVQSKSTFFLFLKIGQLKDNSTGLHVNTVTDANVHIAADGLNLQRAGDAWLTPRRVN